MSSQGLPVLSYSILSITASPLTKHKVLTRVLSSSEHSAIRANCIFKARVKLRQSSSSRFLPISPEVASEIVCKISAFLRAAVLAIDQGFNNRSLYKVNQCGNVETRIDLKCHFSDKKKGRVKLLSFYHSR